MLSFSVSETIEIIDRDGDKPFREWKKRHRREIQKCDIAPTAGGGWRIRVFLPQRTATLTAAAAEYRWLRRLYTAAATTAGEAEKAMLQGLGYRVAELLKELQKN